MKLNLNTKRPAIAMIELIFAIVIMGIVLMSAPMLISTGAKSGYVAIQQEAIHEAASHLNMIMGYHWDENDADELYIDPILDVSASGDDALDEQVIDGDPTSRRSGTPEVSYRTFIRSDGQRLSASPTPLGSDGGDRDDIDDFSGDTDLINIETAVADNVEKTTININAVVAYIPDNPGSGSYTDPGGDNKITFSPNFGANSGTSTNIKRITVTLTSTSTAEELNTKQIILHAFSCNIGGYTLAERGF